VSCVANNGGRQLLTAAAAGDPGIVREVLNGSDGIAKHECPPSHCTQLSVYSTLESPSTKLVPWFNISDNI
jgi:hypothetical protein